MQIENLNIAARPRTAWQAVDLGILMAQRWYLPLLICFALPAAMVALLCVLLIPDQPTLSVVIVWWFKPLYERIPLSFLSTSIFGEVPSAREALGRWRQCVLPGLFPALTYLRLSPTRSFKAPVLVLEGLKGSAKAKRFNVLSASLGNEASWLTILCVHVEAFLNIGLVVFVALLLPAELLGDIWTAYLEGLGTVQAWINNLFYFISIALMGPFYVAAGFALYINQRVELEAWDIELGFRKIARRLSRTAAVVALCCLSQATTAPQAYAQDADEAATTSKTVITEILKSEPYHQKETFSYPKFLETLDWGFDVDPESDFNFDLGWLATLVEICLWIVAVGIILWLVYKLGLLQKLRPRNGRIEAMPPPETLFGVALDSKTLPDDILSAAERSWQSGDQRNALSLLLRGWLLQMINRYGCRFREGDTEADCLRVVKDQTELAAHEGFARLIGLWQRTAYGHQTSAREDFNQLRTDWQSQWANSLA